MKVNKYIIIHTKTSTY